MSDAAIDPRTRPGVVTLTVHDLERTAGFYERALGLVPLGGGTGLGAAGGADARLGSAGWGAARLRLGPAGGDALVELVADPEAPTRPPRTTGLFHLAILVPGRTELARALRRLVAARVPLSGASDHLVSEALYLSDPEGNGIEIYRDRPREEWSRDGGEIRMATLPLDVAALLDEAGDTAGGAPADLAAGVPPETRIGHVHLDVADLTAAEVFYGDVLGLDVTVRGYPGALFMSAGGYHHHLGLNTWRAAGASPPPQDATGLRSFELLVPDAAEVERVEVRLRAAGVGLDRADGMLLASDPWANRVVVRAAAAV